MERSQILDMRGTLKLFGMRNAYDVITASASTDSTNRRASSVTRCERKAEHRPRLAALDDMIEERRAALEDDLRQTVEFTVIDDQMRPLRIEYLPDRALRLIDMLMSADVTNALVRQPAIQLIAGFGAQPRREEAFPHQ